MVCETDNNERSSCSFCGTALGPVSTVAGALPLGARLQGGAFSVGPVLGVGGFGITYLGVDLRLHRLVAIKEFFPYGSWRQGADVRHGSDMSDRVFAAARDRFIHEARVVARFAHPGIVRVYAFFEENDTGYMVMELLRGETLSDLVSRRGPLDEGLALGYVANVAAALHVVHEAGFVHRDLKPDNIFLTEGGRVVLLDFGTAKELLPSHKPVTALVSPGHAPPEQYLTSYRPDPRSDVYSLAASLYHLLTGSSPPEAPERTAGRELTRTIALNPRVSGRVSEAIAEALALDPADRPRGVTEFVERLYGSDAGMPRANPTMVMPRPTPDPSAAQTGLSASPTGCADAQAPQAPEGTDGRSAPPVQAIPPDAPSDAPSPPVQAIPPGAPSDAPSPAVQALPPDAPSGAPSGPPVQVLATAATDAPSEAWRPSLAQAPTQPATPPSRPPVSVAGRAGEPRSGVLEPLEGALPMMPDLAASLPTTAGAGGIDPRAPAPRSGPARLPASSAAPVPPPYLTELARMRGHAGIVRTVDFTPDGEWVLSGSEDKSIRIWGVRSREEHGRFAPHDGWVSCVRASPDGERVATASHDKNVRIWDFETRRMVSSFHGSGGALSLAWHPDGSRLAGGFIDGAVVMWDRDGHEVARVSSGKQSVWTVAFSPDGRLLAFGTWTDACVQLWEVPSWREAGRISAQCGGIRCLAWSPDGRHIALTSKDPAVHLFELATRAESVRLEGHHGGVTSVVFHPSGQYLLSGGTDKSIRLWNVASGRCVQTQESHTGEVMALAVSADGRTVASGSQDDRVGLFQTAG